MTAALDVIRQRAPDAAPRVAITLGSGLGDLGDQVVGAMVIDYVDLPGFPQTTVSGHSGALILGELGDVSVCLLRGRAHYYEQGDAGAMAGAVETMAALGVETMLMTNAAGSLQVETGPGNPMLITDHINFAGANPLIGVEGDRRFVNLSDAYDATLNAILRETAAERGIPLAEGTYMWFSGPSFETPAEIRAAATLGASAVGMSTVPEVILARYHGLRVCAVSLITNLAAGLSDEVLSHDHTKTMAATGAEAMERLITGFLEHYGAEVPRPEEAGDGG